MQPFVRVLLQLILLIFCALNCYAAGKEGFYLGIDAGRFKADLSKKDLVNIALRDSVFDFSDAELKPLIDALKLDDDDYAVRIYGGYNLRPYLGVEGGVFWGGDLDFSGKLDTTVGIESITGEFKHIGGEVMGKGVLPLEQFSVYIKGGVAYMRTTLEGRSTTLSPMALPLVPRGCSETMDAGLFTTVCKEKKRERKIRPVFGTGIEWAVSEDFLVDVSYLRYNEAGDQPALDVFMLSFTLMFGGQERCGDLLC